MQKFLIGLKEKNNFNAKKYVLKSTLAQNDAQTHLHPYNSTEFQILCKMMDITLCDCM